MNKQEEKYYNKNINNTAVERAAFFVRSLNGAFAEYANLISELIDLKGRPEQNRDQETVVIIEQLSTVYKFMSFASFALEQNIYQLPAQHHCGAEKLCDAVLDDLYEMGLEEEILRQKEAMKGFCQNIDTVFSHNFESLVRVALEKLDISEIGIVEEAIDDYYDETKKPPKEENIKLEKEGIEKDIRDMFCDYQSIDAHEIKKACRYPKP